MCEDNKNEWHGNKMKLDGKEFVTTIFNPRYKDSMILVLGDNVDGQSEGLTYLHLYIAVRGEVSHGLDSLAFKTPKEAREFVENIPEMSALDFMFKSLGVRPGYY